MLFLPLECPRARHLVPALVQLLWLLIRPLHELKPRHLGVDVLEIGIATLKQLVNDVHRPSRAALCRHCANNCQVSTQGLEGLEDEICLGWTWLSSQKDIIMQSNLPSPFLIFTPCWSCGWNHLTIFSLSLSLFRLSLSLSRLRARRFYKF